MPLAIEYLAGCTIQMSKRPKIADLGTESAEDSPSSHSSRCSGIYFSDSGNSQLGQCEEPGSELPLFVMTIYV